MGIVWNFYIHSLQSRVTDGAPLSASNEGIQNERWDFWNLKVFLDTPDFSFANMKPFSSNVSPRHWLLAQSQFEAWTKNPKCQQKKLCCYFVFSKFYFVLC